MIKRVGETWTTIQCRNLVGDDGEICDKCFKVLKGRFALTLDCPYCLQRINLRDDPKLDLDAHLETIKAEPAEREPKINAIAGTEGQQFEEKDGIPAGQLTRTTEGHQYEEED
jgi:hypothetical protein